MQTRTETIESPSGPMGVHMVRPDGDDRLPVVVFFHHGPGLDDASKRTMAHVAEWGYNVVAHDRYHRAEPWYTVQSASEDARAKAMELIHGTSEDDVAQDLAALLAWLAADQGSRGAPMGCIGYCLGGRSILRTIRDHGDTFRAAVALHPSFCTTDAPDSPHLAVAGYTGSLYVGFGAADTKQPPSANTAFIEAVNALDKGQAEIHDGADHGFGVLGHNHHEAAATRSYEHAKAIFARAL